MIWTTEKPTKPGWYWYRRKPKKRFDGTGILQCTVYVYDAVGGLFCEFYNGELGRIDILRGQWAGPIPEPEEQA